jgi:N6-L-threonylcarbamoyladenine synthase
MKILGIESSADETAAAIVVNGTTLLSNTVSSSLSLHNKTGGIVPEIASREQLRYIIPTLSTVLSESSEPDINDIDAIAVTVGPGLIGSLLIGVETAKTISYIYKKPIIPVNHVHAHLYANWLQTKNIPKFPSLGLIVSGGHTELFLIRSHTDWKWLGGTLDDAAGEAFDKIARLLGLDYPGGPQISNCAKIFQDSASQKTITKFPRPMLNSEDLNFSFSGLKTAVIKEISKIKNLDNNLICEFSYEIQEAITDVLVYKTLKAAQHYDVASLILGGGVSANRRLAEKFISKIQTYYPKLQLHVPSTSLCTDNAASIASYAYFHYLPTPWTDIHANPNLEVEI